LLTELNYSRKASLKKLVGSDRMNDEERGDTEIGEATENDSQRGEIRRS
jgi:hypothetical protein